MLLANQRGFVLQSNHRARRVLEQHDGLLLDENGHLVAADPHLAGELAELLRLTGHPGPVAPAPAAQLLIPRRDFRRPLLVSVSLLARPQAVSPGANLPTVTVQLLDPDPNTLPRPEVLQQLFDLTKSEAEVCRRLAAGLTVEETAVALFVSLNTVRTHLKRVLSKTNTRRQPELTALLNQIAAQQLVE